MRNSKWLGKSSWNYLEETSEQLLSVEHIWERAFTHFEFGTTSIVPNQVQRWFLSSGNNRMWSQNYLIRTIQGPFNGGTVPSPRYYHILFESFLLSSWHSAVKFCLVSWLVLNSERCVSPKLPRTRFYFSVKFTKLATTKTLIIEKTMWCTLCMRVWSTSSLRNTLSNLSSQFLQYFK